MKLRISWPHHLDGDTVPIIWVHSNGQGNAIWDQENFDEDTTLQMLDWYYSKSRAV